MSQSIHVFWNGDASRASALQEFRQTLDGQSDVTVHETGDLQTAVRSVLQSHIESDVRLVAAGGDGTVSTVASVIVEQQPTRATFAVLPLGTGNDFARSLGMPLDLQEAFDVCRTGDAKAIDVIETNSTEGRRFVFNMATAGNTGRLVDSIDEDFKKQWGVFSYVRAGIMALADLTPYELQVEVDGRPLPRCEAINVFIANGRSSGGGVQVAPQASLSDGLLDYVIVLNGSIGRLTCLAADYVLDRLLENDLIVHGQARSITLEGSPPLQFSTDGESVSTPLSRFSVRPRALSAVVGPLATTTPIGAPAEEVAEEFPLMAWG